jgi:hypothetical protein
MNSTISSVASCCADNPDTSSRPPQPHIPHAPPGLHTSTWYVLLLFIASRAAVPLLVCKPCLQGLLLLRLVLGPKPCSAHDILSDLLCQSLGKRPLNLCLLPREQGRGAWTARRDR